MLNKHVDQIYCINLKSRPERKERFLKRLTTLADTDESKLTFIEAVDGSKLEKVPPPFDAGWPHCTAGAYGCLKSHVKTLEHAIENRFNTILIFEDDVTFREGFKTTFETCLQHQQDLPSHWESIFLGANYQGLHSNVNKWFSKGQAYGAQAYLIRNNWDVFKQIVDWGNTTPTEPIDVFYCKHLHNKHTNFFTNPLLCSQEPGRSDIEGRDVDHRGVLGGF